MNAKLKRALELLPEYEQEALGQLLLDQFAEDDMAWEAAFAASPEKLVRLREEIRQAHLKGETKLLDPEKL
jgi:hypothetical protein